MWNDIIRVVNLDGNYPPEEQKEQKGIMTDETIELWINHINEMITIIRKEGRSVRAKGKYLELEDVLEVELSDKHIE